jgi:hypothetical protein
MKRRRTPFLALEFMCDDIAGSLRAAATVVVQGTVAYLRNGRGLT